MNHKPLSRPIERLLSPHFGLSVIIVDGLKRRAAGEDPLEVSQATAHALEVSATPDQLQFLAQTLFLSIRPEAASHLMDLAIRGFIFGPPPPPLESVRADAEDWVLFASPFELTEYMRAIWLALSVAKRDHALIWFRQNMERRR